MEIPLADDSGSNYPSDSLDNDPRPKPEKRYDHDQNIRIRLDMPYVGIFAAIQS